MLPAQSECCVNFTSADVNMHAAALPPLIRRGAKAAFLFEGNIF